MDTKNACRSVCFIIDNDVFQKSSQVMILLVVVVSSFLLDGGEEDIGAYPRGAGVGR